MKRGASHFLLLWRVPPRHLYPSPFRLGALIALVLLSASAAAQQPPADAPPPQPQAGAITQAFSVEGTSETVTLTYFNRPIVVLRARILGRGPTERAASTVRVLDELVGKGITGPVTSQPLDNNTLILVAEQMVTALTVADLDTLTGETLEGVTAQATSRLQQALDEAHEARRPGVLLRAAAYSIAGLIVSALALWGLGQLRRAVNRRAERMTEQTAAKAGIVDVQALRASRILDVQRGIVRGITILLQLFVVYAIVTFVLRRFPYTRPWGESLRDFLISTFSGLALGFANAMPGLFTVVVIFVITRFLSRLLALWFASIERGQVEVSWLHPETAQPTKRLLNVMLWMFAIVVAYPYMPGSDTDAFRGVSVFFGLMLTLGSSGVVNQVMSGFMVTFSRALRVGDFVKIGDVEGTVVQLGILSTKVRTLRREEVTIPNAVVVGQQATNYSRNAKKDGVVVSTTVTIGYNTPWRQVEALLLEAASRTDGLRTDPSPKVMQAALEDFYVRYVLLVSLERPETRLFTLNELHGHIQDLFNEYGVQIMSPNYEADPEDVKVVPKKDWFAAPARPDPKPEK